MNGLTLIGLIGMAWVAVSVLLGIGIGRCCYDTSDEAELVESAREAAKRWHPAGGRRDLS